MLLKPPHFILALTALMLVCFGMSAQQPAPASAAQAENTRPESKPAPPARSATPTQEVPAPLSLDLPDPFAEKEQKLIKSISQEKISAQLRYWKLRGVLISAQKGLCIVEIPSNSQSAQVQMLHLLTGSKIPCTIAGITVHLTVDCIEPAGIHLRSDDGLKFFLN